MKFFSGMRFMKTENGVAYLTIVMQLGPVLIMGFSAFLDDGLRHLLSSAAVLVVLGGGMLSVHKGIVMGRNWRIHRMNEDTFQFWDSVASNVGIGVALWVLILCSS